MSKAFFEIAEAPVFCNALHSTREAALKTRTGRIALAFDEASGVIVNEAFEPEKAAYSDAYENSLHVSPTFDAWARDLAGGLVERWGLQGGTVVDVGCGGGEFLALLRQAGAGRCVGFEPGRSRAQAQRASEASGAEVRSAAFPDGGDLKPRLLTCRHVLEHIAKPTEFLRAMRGGLEAGAGVYIEVPSADYMLREAAVWDVLYEHCNYFTGESLPALMRQTGFERVEARESFGGQYLLVEARAGRENGGAALAVDDAARRRAARFGNVYAVKVSAWRDRLRALAREGGKACVWGAGTKGVMFLCAMREAEALDAVAFAIDLNPKKHGRFTPLTGVETAAPERLAQTRVDLILAMNPLYRAEIESAARRLGCQAMVEVV